MTRDELDALAAAWPECDYWSCDDGPDELRHASIGEAFELERFVDEAQLARWAGSGRTFRGWTRKVVSQADIDSMVESLTTAFHEHWCDALELGNPDDDGDRDEPEWLRAAITNDMRARHVHQCDLTDAVELTAEQILGIARLARPELFEAAP